LQDVYRAEFACVDARDRRRQARGSVHDDAAGDTNEGRGDAGGRIAGQRSVLVREIGERGALRLAQ
jgi:hypothetical protein